MLEAFLVFLEGFCDGSEIKAAPMTYDIQTWGWTTDAVVSCIVLPLSCFGLEMIGKIWLLVWKCTRNY